MNTCLNSCVYIFGVYWMWTCNIPNDIEGKESSVYGGCRNIFKDFKFQDYKHCKTELAKMEPTEIT